MADDYTRDELCRDLVDMARAGNRIVADSACLNTPPRSRDRAALDIARDALEAIARRCGDEGDVVIALTALEKIETLLDRGGR